VQQQQEHYVEEDYRHRLHRLHVERLARITARAYPPKPKPVIYVQVPLRIFERPLLALRPITFKGNASSSTLLVLLSRYFGLPVDTIIGPVRLADYIRVRHICFYVFRKAKPWSTLRIGRVFRKDHSSILNGCLRVSAAIADDDALRREVTDLICFCKQAIEPGFDFIDKR
jgi:hypothetical protein